MEFRKFGKVVHDNPVEEQIASLIDEAGVHKAAAKVLCARNLGEPDRWDKGAMIPRLMETMFHDLMEEKLYTELKKMRMPTVNFKVLKGAVYRAIKDNGEEYFR